MTPLAAGYDRCSKIAPLDRVACPSCRSLLDPDALSLARHLARCPKAAPADRRFAIEALETLAQQENDLAGRTFGYLYVLGEIRALRRQVRGSHGTYIARTWRVRCDAPMVARPICGRLDVARTPKLLMGEWTSCSKCRVRRP